MHLASSLCIYSKNTTACFFKTWMFWKIQRYIVQGVHYIIMVSFAISDIYQKCSKKEYFEKIKGNTTKLNRKTTNFSKKYRKLWQPIQRFFRVNSVHKLILLLKHLSFYLTMNTCYTNESCFDKCLVNLPSHNRSPGPGWYRPSPSSRSILPRAVLLKWTLQPHPHQALVYHLA